MSHPHGRRVSSGSPRGSVRGAPGGRGARGARGGPGATGGRGARGAVTAELALALPLLLAVCVGLVWLLALATAQTRVVDASREAARAVARGDDPGAARGLATRIAPPGATVSVGGGSDRVEVVTRAVVRGPGGLFDVLPGVEVSARAVAVREPG